MRIRMAMVAALFAVAACGGATDQGATNDSDEAAGEGSSGRAPVTLTQPEAGDREDTPSALDDMRHPSFPDPLVDPDEILSGGPPPDGIPPIDEPKFERARDVGWLADQEGVLSLTVGDETRAYPLQVMTWHEIVNDTVDGVPVAVTYCPLCNSGVAFERQTDDRLLSFGTSGMLHANNLVMYDRQTQSLWPQLTGQASVGALTGEQLTAIPVGTVAWSDFVAEHPGAWVLSRDTGHSRPYGSNPYTGYDDPDSGLLFDLPEEDDRLPLKARVVGVAHGGDAVGLLRSAVAEAGVMEISVGRRELVVWHRPGQASALDTQDVSTGRDIGTVGVFSPVVDGRTLHFRVDGEGFRDRETGSRWSVLGTATAGPLEGTTLAPQTHLDTFWFSWVDFQPQTRVVR